MTQPLNDEILGTIPTYNLYGNKIDWQIFEDQFNNYLYLNNIQYDNKKISLLLLSIHEDMYNVVKWFSWPIEPINYWQHNYAELCNVINGQFPVLKCLSEAFCERLTFYSDEQQIDNDESAMEWFYRIRQLSMNCKFGQFFETMLLDRFISGLRQSSLLDKLLNEQRQLSLHDTLELVQKFEK